MRPRNGTSAGLHAPHSPARSGAGRTCPASGSARVVPPQAIPDPSTKRAQRRGSTHPFPPTKPSRDRTYSDRVWFASTRMRAFSQRAVSGERLGLPRNGVDGVLDLQTVCEMICGRNLEGSGKMRVVTLDTPRSVGQRPSAAERELVVRRLREGCQVERLSLDTFSARVAEAYVATSRAQLEELVVDLPGRSAFVRALSAAVRCLSRLTALVEDAWREPRTPPLALPGGSTVTLGRSRECDCVLTDPTVSRRHACVRYRDGSWWLRDRGESGSSPCMTCRHTRT